jgi:hypothetical protein
VRSTAVKGVKPVMNFVTRTRVLVLLVLGLGAGLLVAALGNAGTNTTLFQAFEGPTTLRAAHEGLTFAKFQPNQANGAATHTVITFTFQPTGAFVNPTPDPATSPDCAPTPTDPLTIVCAVGTVNPGQLVKRFVTFTGGTAGLAGNVTVSVAFDAGSGGAKGGGQVNPPDPITLPVTIVDGTTADGTCDVGGGSIQTAPVGKNVLQQTKLAFGASANPLPCTYGGVGVLPINGTPPGGGAPAISQVEGPTFGQPATLTISFSSLPVPIKKFVLKESLVDPSIAKPSDWKPVPFCTDPGAATADTCIVGYDSGNPIVGHLLFRGIGVDPWYD